MARSLILWDRHLNQSRGTADGNFHCIKSTKNTDRKDYLLYEGTAFFPTDKELKDHLERVPLTKDLSDWMPDTNTGVNAATFSRCPWIFSMVKGMTMYYTPQQEGTNTIYRYANVDLALARDIRQKLTAGPIGEFTVDIQMEIDNIDHVYSYDAAC
ncbi:hypothetical protein C8R44DRAFT_729086 [Mycena epipterygia]|nr:hypothetical protein C8R44DRAFT_729086 [Mycena epipterygia]